jgi:hypothetical protein
MNPKDHIQIVTFSLAGLDPEDYRAHCEAVAPAFTEIPGLRAKAWLANPKTNTYGGLYAWESPEAMDAYLRGPVFGALQAKAGIGEVITRDFGLLAGPTRVTSGDRSLEAAL